LEREHPFACWTRVFFRRRLDALKGFSAYLAQASIERQAEDLYHDAQAWWGMSVGLLKGFRKWLLEQGFAIGTLNHRLCIIRQYCRLANTAGTIPIG
jgi:hypothetical protein